VEHPVRIVWRLRLRNTRPFLAPITTLPARTASLNTSRLHRRMECPSLPELPTDCLQAASTVVYLPTALLRACHSQWALGTPLALRWRRGLMACTKATLATRRKCAGCSRRSHRTLASLALLPLPALSQPDSRPESPQRMHMLPLWRVRWRKPLRGMPFPVRFKTPRVCPARGEQLQQRQPVHPLSATWTARACTFHHCWRAS